VVVSEAFLVGRLVLNLEHQVDQVAAVQQPLMLTGLEARVRQGKDLLGVLVLLTEAQHTEMVAAAVVLVEPVLQIAPTETVVQEEWAYLAQFLEPQHSIVVVAVDLVAVRVALAAEVLQETQQQQEQPTEVGVVVVELVH
jgi:uncharacterized membrane protein